MVIRIVGGWVSDWVFLLVPAHLGSPGQRAVKRLLLLLDALPDTSQWNHTPTLILPSSTKSLLRELRSLSDASTLAVTLVSLKWYGCDVLQVSSSVPLVPRCNIDDLLLAIEAAPSKSSSPPVSSLGRRSKSACVGSGSLVKCPPLPPIQSNSSQMDAAAAADNTSTISSRPRARPSSAYVAGSSQSPLQQPRDEPPAESFFMTEVPVFYMSLTCLCLSIHIRCFNSHFPGKPGLCHCPDFSSCTC